MDCFTSDTELTKEELEEYDNLTPVRGRISYSNASLDVFGLVSRLRSGDIVIPRMGCNLKELEVSSFQRGFVWKKRQMDSFIESMLLGYPTPSLFFVNQGDGRMLVLDGQQRLETLRMFYDGLYNDKVYKLSLTDSQFNRASYKTLEPDSRRFLDNTYLSAIIIRLEDGEHAVDAVYDVFARLNSGGTKLTPHEIRMALYNGKLMEEIDRINQDKSWRRLYGGNPNVRFRDHELVLRILALYMCEEEYKKPLGTFLNSFSKRYRRGSESNPALKEAYDLFNQAAGVYSVLKDETLFSTGERRQLNSSRADSLMIGAMRCLAKGKTLSEEALRSARARLRDSDAYNHAVSEATSDEQSVHTRILEVVKALENE